MIYTNVPKPTSTAYLNVNTVGKQQYDQPELSYDDATTFYDGVNQSAYTTLAKPVTVTYTNIPKPI